MGNIEETLLEINDELEEDHELYTSTTSFRNAEKLLENTNFKKIMKSYEDYKEEMNRVIHRLEKDIQFL